MNDIKNVWKNAQNLIQKEIPALSYETWIQNLAPLKQIADTFYLLPENDLELGYIKARYSSIIKNALHHVDPNINKVIFLSKDDDIPEIIPEINVSFDEAGNTEDNSINPLNPKYTFDRFVIGENNRFARAACVAVAESPSNIYNPLFIYGGVGLGKTHLMQAVGNYIYDEEQERKVVYVSCEDFTNEFITSIQKNKSIEFRKKYRTTDILLIDDIQFIAGKMETQEAFFHTFNTLYEANKQIVITSDKPPKDIPKLEDRLRSRFEMGLITDISAPSLETRIAILKKKAEIYDVDIPDEVFEYIAENIHSNIRELEGALTRIMAYHNLNQIPITLPTAKEALKDLLDNDVQVIDIPYIKKITAKYFNVTTNDLDSKKRTQSVALPRQVAMYLCREFTESSFPKIGENFGGRDHSTVLHACKKIAKEMDNETEFTKLVNTIKNEIENSIQ